MYNLYIMGNLDFKNQAVWPSKMLLFNFLWDRKLSYKINILPSLGIQGEGKQEHPECKNAEHPLIRNIQFSKICTKKDANFSPFPLSESRRGVGEFCLGLFFVFWVFFPPQYWDLQQQNCRETCSPMFYITSIRRPSWYTQCLISQFNLTLITRNPLAWSPFHSRSPILSVSVCSLIISGIKGLGSTERTVRTLLSFSDFDCLSELA